VAGRFTILKALGAGGGGRVYLAEQALGSTKRRLALKMLLPEHASNPEMVQRFLRECEMLSLVEHPNVVRIHDFGEAMPGVLYIAMELVAGGSLADAIAEGGALAPERALAVLTQICRGVAAVHDRGIVHRDLKPENLMLVRLPEEPELVKVVDFGIAKTLEPPEARGADVTHMGTVIGSPPHMSPEQFLGGAIDIRTDVYALGIVAYEMFTGELPFEANDLEGWATVHASKAPRPFDATPAGRAVSEPVRRAILRALAKRPEDRHPSARAFLRRLSEASRPAPSKATSTSTPRAWQVPSRPSRAVGVGWGLMALLAAAAGSIFVLAATTLSNGAATASRPAQPSEPSLVVLAAVSASPPPVIATSSKPVEPSREATQPPTTKAVATRVMLPLSPVSARAPTRPAAPPAPVPSKPAVYACEHGLRASTCDEARFASTLCPDAPGVLHDRVFERVRSLCAEPDRRSLR
jgi:serine/threonine-protein kinase